MNRPQTRASSRHPSVSQPSTSKTSEEIPLPPKKRPAATALATSTAREQPRKTQSQSKALTKVNDFKRSKSIASTSGLSDESPPKKSRGESSSPEVIDSRNLASKEEVVTHSRKKLKVIGSRIGSIVSKNSSDPGNGSRASNTESTSSSSTRRRSSRLSNKSSNTLSSLATATVATSGLSDSSLPSLDQASVPTTSCVNTSSKTLKAMDPTESSGAAQPAVDATKNSSTTPVAGLPSSSGTSSGTGDEGDDSEMGRLQALLEARGLPPHIFGALGPRMQHLLHRSMGTSTSSKAHQLLQGISSENDESQQLQAVVEMCQLLVMGNEDTLAGFPVKQAVPALVTLLQMEHNFDMMNHAVRALTYMMESLPRSSAVVVEAVPVILEKLQAIQCMDVAEQSLTALEMLSRRHSKNILHAKGVNACLIFLDFFSINAQRAALAITANCFQNLTCEEFNFVKDSLPVLSNHLTSHDKKSIESICLAFSRIVDSFSQNANILNEVAGNNLLANLQQLLVITPNLISTGTFVMVIRMMATMCSVCPHLAVDLLKLDISGTLRSLLLNPQSKEDELELTPRSPQELYELVSLIGELMPRLPTDGIFSVDTLLSKNSTPDAEAVVWQWKDDRGLWQPYSCLDSKVIETSHEAGEDETSISTNGRSYVIDFNSMQQINEESGTSRIIQRKVNSGDDHEGCDSASVSKDPRAVCLESDVELAQSLVRSLFGLLYEVYSSSAGPSVRQKCLRALLRIIYYAPSDLLECVLKNQAVSRHISAMLASPDLRIIVGALQMANILMEKLPSVFCIYFRREGVMHQITKLAAMEPETPTPKVSSLAGIPSAPSETSIASNLDLVQSPTDPTLFDCPVLTSTWPGLIPPPYEMTRSPAIPNLQPPQLTTSDLPPVPTTEPARSSRGKSEKSRKSHRKARSHHPTGKPDSRSHGSSSTTAGDTAGSAPIAVPLHLPFPGPSTSGMSLMSSETLSHRMGGSSFLAQSLPESPRRRFVGKVASSTSSFFASLHPGRWSRWSSNPSVQQPSIASPLNSPSSVISARGMSISSHLSSSASHHHRDHAFHVPCSSTSSFSSPRTPAIGYNNPLNREKIRSWIREEAKKFEKKYFSTPVTDSGPSETHPALLTLNRLNVAVESFGTKDNVTALEELKSVLLSGDISPFELIHSGVVRRLYEFLTTNEDQKRDDRVRCFLKVFMGAPLHKTDPISISGKAEKKPLILDPQPLSVLVMKLNACVSQLEQFPVRVHDIIGTGTGNIRGTSALKFFNTHQLKCNLQRHPSCTNLRQWRGGPVKIDPLALVQAIEKYLVLRGYGRVREEDEEGSDDDNSDEEFDDNVAAMMLNQGTGRHRLQFFIGEHPLPYNMTVYQTIRQFSGHSSDGHDDEADGPVGHANMWTQTHLIHYKPYTDPSPSSSSRASTSSTSAPAPLSRKGKASKSTSSTKKKDELWTDGKVPNVISPVDKLIETSLPASIATGDSSFEAISLLRVLHALNSHWNLFYSPSKVAKPAIPASEFINIKLSSKVNRQLQDPLVIMTGNLPNWLSALAYSCPFLFPFETRHLLFYVTCFDRDRALQRLIDSTPGMNSSDTAERVTPRLDRRKKTVSREDLLRQAELVFQDSGSSKSLLEIQYENEVGTGLGPTLEFYSLVSHEMQRADQEMWRGDVVSTPNASNKSAHIKARPSPSHEIEPVIKSHNKHSETGHKGQVKYIFSPNGLFPVPLPRNVKTGTLTRIKNRYKLLGKFMAKALMDSRLVDIPFSITFYKWLLGKEGHLSLTDMEHVDPALSKSLIEMETIAKRKAQLQAKNENCDGLRMASLTLDGCSIDDLGLDFTLPGYPNIELKKGGKDTPVTLDNIEQYLSLLCHWTLNEGVSKQFDSLKEGFESVFPISHLSLFYPEELDQLFCGSGTNKWDMKTLTESCHADHGYTMDSRAIKFLFEILSSYDVEEQRKFLQFITGSPRLPVGGLKSLTPPMTIVRKTTDSGDLPDNYLPSVMTCVNYLKLPDYSSIDIMRQKLKLAADEGQNSFHLS